MFRAMNSSSLFLIVWHGTPSKALKSMSRIGATTRIFLWDLAEGEINGVYQAVSNAASHLLPEVAGVRRAYE